MQCVLYYILGVSIELKGTISNMKSRRTSTKNDKLLMCYLSTYHMHKKIG